MGKNVINIINNGNGTKTEINIPDGGNESLVIEAQSNSSYEIKNLSKNLAPDMIKATRKGNDLEIKILNETESENDDATVVIKDYYENGEGQIFGVAEDGNLYLYSPQELDSTMLAENLDDGMFSYQSLNTDQDGGFLPILLGVLGAGALAGAGGGGGGSGQAATIDPTPGSITVEATVDDANAQVDISGTTSDVPAGATISITITDSEGNSVTTTATVASDGTYSVDDIDVSSLVDGDLTTTVSRYYRLQKQSS